VYFDFSVVLLLFLRFYGWCDFVNAWNALVCWLGFLCVVVQGNSGEKVTLSPKRACLAQARLAETSQVHIRALAQAESSCLSEAMSRSSEKGSPQRDRVETLACRYSFNPGEGPHFWAKGGLAQARRARLSEIAWRPWLVAIVSAQARGLTFGQGVVSLRQGGLA